MALVLPLVVGSVGEESSHKPKDLTAERTAEAFGEVL